MFLHVSVCPQGVHSGGVHLGMHPSGLLMDAPPTRNMHPPEVCLPRNYAPEDRRSTGGQYASYYNAFLLPKASLGRR